MTLFNVTQARRIASGFFPDPTICEKPEGGYLMVNSSFEFFPGLPVWESEDGEHWGLIGYAMDRPEQFSYDSMGNSQGIYAPTLRWHDGTYYLIVTNVNRGNMILTTRDPHAGWSDPIWVDGWPGIDPSLFFDDDGTAYICGNEGSSGEEKPGIYLAAIDPDRGRVLTERVHICGGITGSNPEGPHLYKRRGMYYLMWAEGGTESGHMENIARSSAPFGPYEMYPGNPMLTNRSTHLTLQAIGHCDCAHIEDDRTLMVFHGTRNNDEYPAQGWIGREPYAVWFEWGEDGWPHLSDQSYDTPLEGDGSAAERNVSWITPGIDADHRYWVMAPPHRHHEEADVALPPQDDGAGAPNGPVEGGQESHLAQSDGATAPNGPVAGPQVDQTAQSDDAAASDGPDGPEGPLPATITVDVIEQDFSLQAGPPLIGTRQTCFTCCFTATVADTGQLAMGEAGIAAYANADHYITVAFRAAEHVVCQVEASVHNAGLVSVVGRVQALAAHPLTLVLEGDARGYACSLIEHPFPDGGFEANEPVVHDLGRIPGKVLSFSNAGGFTGTLLGVYAHGAGAVTFTDVTYA